MSYQVLQNGYDAIHYIQWHIDLILLIHPKFLDLMCIIAERHILKFQPVRRFMLTIIKLILMLQYW